MRPVTKEELLNLIERYRTAGCKAEHFYYKDLLEIAIDNLIHQSDPKFPQISASLIPYKEQN